MSIHVWQVLILLFVLMAIGAVMVDGTKEKKKKEKSIAETWAEREIKLACVGEKEYGSKFRSYMVACYESAFKAYECLCKDGHSGISNDNTKYILDRLINRKPLTPIYDTPDAWNQITELENGYITYQCIRYAGLFKDVYTNGKIVYSDVRQCTCIDMPTGMTYRDGLVSNIIREMFPITFPYMPANSPIKVYCEGFLTDRKTGDYDTLAIIYAVKPDGDKVQINRYFKDNLEGPGMIEIDKVEYLEYFYRKGMAKEMEEKEKVEDDPNDL